MYDQLISLCDRNREFFNKDKTDVGAHFQSSFKKISEFLLKSNQVLKQIKNFAGIYDFDEKTPGNGFRSFIFIFDAAVNYIDQTCKLIAEKKGKIFFRKGFYAKEIDVCSQMVESLFQIGEGLIGMHEIAENGTLYARSCHYDNIISRSAKFVNQECFYGRSIGFQYYESLKPSLKLVAVSLTSYSEFYFSKRNILSKSVDLLTMIKKYSIDPELCAQRICNINRNADIHFFSSFLKLCETKPIHTFISFSGYGVDVNRVFEIRPQPMQVFSPKLGKSVDVPIPMSHIGAKPISCRLISSRRRIDMISEETDCSLLPFAEPSECLIFHVHGGGWISQSSKAHEIYLREWATKLEVPIISVDYSLAPEAPFPRAIEEVFYAYCWVLNNLSLVGSTGAKIVFVGDSAGGNISTACIIKMIEMGIPLPQGSFNAYSIFLVNMVKTPARIMGMFDSFLPFGLVMKIFKSYAQGKAISNDSLPSEPSKGFDNSKKFHKSEIPKAPDDEFVFEIPRNYLLAPYWAPDDILKEFPPTKMVSMVTDPCLDDCVEFGKKLKRLNVDTQIEILGGLFHGFLSFTQLSRECHDGSQVCMRHIAELLGLNIE